MLTPRQPVEARRQGRFRPPHCPFKECDAHRGPTSFRWCRWGFYRRACDPRRRVRRFRCLHCRRTFSTQSFACTYYLKRPVLLSPVAAGLVAGSAHRQIARTLRCAPSTVTRMSARLGRHCLLFHELARRLVPSGTEPVVADHFETFVFSQLDRLGIVTPVGQRSWFAYGLEGASHRGSSRRGVRKRALRRPLPERQPGSVARSFRAMLDALTGDDGATLDLVTDDNPAYPAAIASHPARRRIRHRAYRNPPRGPGADREVARERDRAMFPVDVLHGLLRHSQAHHRRETIAFGRRSNAVLERMALALVWRNHVKRRSERTGEPVTPAMRVGIASRPFRWREVLAERLFPERVGLRPTWRRIYRRELTTPAVGPNRRHRLRHAY